MIRPPRGASGAAADGDVGRATPASATPSTGRPAPSAGPSAAGPSAPAPIAGPVAVLRSWLLARLRVCLLDLRAWPAGGAHLRAILLGWAVGSVVGAASIGGCAAGSCAKPPAEPTGPSSAPSRRPEGDPSAPSPSAAPAGERVAVVRKPGRRDPKWAQARCNDGTAFAYEVRPGPTPVWVINLSGGFFCDDEVAPCSERQRRLITSLPGSDGDPTRMKTDGIFSLDPALNPTFAGANHVDAQYCSSDLWLGDSVERRPTTGDPVDGWYFSGRENVRVLLEALREVEGLDEARPETRILVLGTSAGAAGVVGNLDQLQQAFPRAIAERRLHLVLDGGWVAPPPEGVRVPNAAKWGPPHRGCAASEADPGRCVLGPVWWPFVAETGIPVLVQISALDKTQTPLFGIDTPEEIAAWRQTVWKSLEDAGVPWVFSAGTAYHVVAIDERFGRGPPGRSFREVLDRFWAGGPPERIFLQPQ